MYIEVVKGYCIVTSDVMSQRTVPCTAGAVQDSTGGGQIRRDGRVCACCVLWKGRGGPGQLLWVGFEWPCGWEGGSHV